MIERCLQLVGAKFRRFSSEQVRWTEVPPVESESLTLLHDNLETVRDDDDDDDDDMQCLMCT